MLQLEREHAPPHKQTSIHGLIKEGGLNELLPLIRDDRMLPVLTVPMAPDAKRTDNTSNIMEEAANFSGVMIDQNVIAGLVVPPSGHTNKEVRRDDLIQAVRRNTSGKGDIPFSGEKVPAQLLAFVCGLNEEGQEVDYERYDLLRLSQMTDKGRGPFLSATAEQLEHGVKILSEALQIPDNEAEKKLRIYATFGHATTEERVKTGLIRGAQSQQELHFNITALDEHISEATTLQEIELPTIMKQIGVWDTAVWNLFNPAIEKRMQTVLEEKHKNIPVVVHAEKAHVANKTYKRVIFHEGYTLNFVNDKRPAGVPIHDALNMVLDVIGDYSELYEELKQDYETYQLHYADSEKTEKTYADAEKKAVEHGFTPEEAKQLVGMAFSVKPTYMQVLRLLNDEHGEKPTGASSDRLNRLEKQYSNIRNRFNKRTKENPNAGFEDICSILKMTYGLDDLECQIYTRMIQDQVASFEGLNEEQLSDVLRQTENTFPVHLSGSLLISDWHMSSDGTILVDKVSLASRFNQKGVAEDLIGAALKRKAGV